MSAGVLRGKKHMAEFLSEEALRDAIEEAMTEAAGDKESVRETKE
jgi:hypothetical protein